MYHSYIIPPRSLSHPFYVTFVEQNHQLNHLPPTDLKNLNHLDSSELSLHFTEKTSSVTLTVFLIKLLRNYTCTDRHTHILLLFLRLLHKITCWVSRSPVRPSRDDAAAHSCRPIMLLSNNVTVILQYLIFVSIVFYSLWLHNHMVWSISLVEMVV